MTAFVMQTSDSVCRLSEL